MANNLYLNRTMEGLIKEASKYFLLTKCLTLCEHNCHLFHPNPCRFQKYFLSLPTNSESNTQTIMEAVLTRPENDTVEAYWKMLSTLSRTVKLSLASKLTKSVLDDEIAERSSLPSRKAKVIRRAVATPSDAELETRFANQEMPQVADNDPEWRDIIKANSGKTIKPIEKWL